MVVAPKKNEKSKSSGVKIGYKYDTETVDSASDSDESGTDSKEYLPTVCKFNLYKVFLSMVIK